VGLEVFSLLNSPSKDSPFPEHPQSDEVLRYMVSNRTRKRVSGTYLVTGSRSRLRKIIEEDSETRELYRRGVVWCMKWSPTFGHPWRLFESRGPHNCPQYERARKVGKLGHNVFERVCRRCGYLHRCKFVRQFHVGVGLLIAPMEALRFRRKLGGKLLVIEGPIPVGRTASLSLNELRQAAAHSIHAEITRVFDAIAALLEAQQPGSTLQGRPLFDALSLSTSLADIAELPSWQPRGLTYSELLSPRPGPDGKLVMPDEEDVLGYNCQPLVTALRDDARIHLDGRSPWAVTISDGLIEVNPRPIEDQLAWLTKKPVILIDGPSLSEWVELIERLGMVRLESPPPKDPGKRQSQQDRKIEQVVLAARDCHARDDDVHMRRLAKVSGVAKAFISRHKDEIASEFGGHWEEGPSRSQKLVPND
jgi:hypothetical protein